MRSPGIGLPQDQIRAPNHLRPPDLPGSQMQMPPTAPPPKTAMRADHAFSLSGAHAETWRNLQAMAGKRARGTGRPDAVAEAFLLSGLPELYPAPRLPIHSPKSC